MKEDKLDADTAAYLGSEVAVQVEASGEAAAALEAEGNISASLTARTELADALATRVATLAPAPEAATAEPMMMKTMMVADAPPAEENPRETFIAALRVSADEVAEARTHTAAAFLPGIVDASLDLAALDADGKEEPADGGVDAAAGTSLMMTTDETATSTVEETFDAKVKFVPPQNNAWPSGSTEMRKAFWIPESR
jgi:hypothetical protein